MKRVLLPVLLAAATLAQAAAPAPKPADGPHPWTPVAFCFWGDSQSTRIDADVRCARLGLFYSQNHDVSLLDFALGCTEAEGDESALQVSCVNIVDGNEAGLQLGLFANWVNESHHGIQVAGLFNFGGFEADRPVPIRERKNNPALAPGENFVKIPPSAGLQLAGGFNRSRDFTGLQLAFLMNSSRCLRGGQIAAINMPAKDSIHGFQLGLVNSGAFDFHGLQAGVICTSCARDSRDAAGNTRTFARLSGLQLGLVTSTGDLHGGQVGVVNLADSVSGFQLGVYNRAKVLRRGVQIGLLNQRGDSDIPFLPLVRATF